MSSENEVATSPESLDQLLLGVEAINTPSETLLPARRNAIQPVIGRNDSAAGRPLGFCAKYQKLAARHHQVLPGRALTSAQLVAFGDLLIAARAAAISGRSSPLLIEAALGANETVAEDGGFLVEKEIADGLLRRTFEVATLGNRARRIQISGGSNGTKINAVKDDSRATGARWGGIQAYWIVEGEAMTPSRPKFRQIELSLRKISGLLYATSEMMQDSVALAGVIEEAFPLEFAFNIDDAIFRGEGSARPLGFMRSPAKMVVAREMGQAARTILPENITNMFARLPASSISRAEWYVNQDTVPALMGLAQVIGTDGVPLFLPPGGLSAAPYGTLLGRPVIPSEHADTLGTEGDIVFADMSGYLLVDKGDIQAATSLHVAYLTDEQAFRFIYRVDGQPFHDKPITPFKGVTKLSQFVTLESR